MLFGYVGQGKWEVFRILKYIARGGTSQQKYKLLRQKVWEEFSLMRRDQLVIHDHDLSEQLILQLRSYHYRIQGTFVFLIFKNESESSWWLYYFKTQHNIFGRKITKMVSQKSKNDAEKIAEFWNLGIYFGIYERYYAFNSAASTQQCKCQI